MAYPTDIKELLKISREQKLILEKQSKIISRQEMENEKLSRRNFKLALSSIFIAIILGVPAFINLFKDATDQILLESKEQNRLLKKDIEMRSEMYIYLDSLHDQLTLYLKSSKTNQLSDEKNVP